MQTLSSLLRVAYTRHFKKAALNFSLINDRQLLTAFSWSKVKEISLTALFHVYALLY